MDFRLHVDGNVRHHVVLVAFLSDGYVERVSALLLLGSLFLRLVSLRLVLCGLFNLNGDLLLLFLVDSFRSSFLSFLEPFELLLLLLVGLQFL